MLDDTDDYTPEELQLYRSLENYRKPSTYKNKNVSIRSERDVNKLLNKKLYFLFSPQEKDNMIVLYENYLFTNKLSREECTDKYLETFKKDVPRKKIVSFFKNYGNRQKLNYLHNRAKQYCNILDEKSINNIHLDLCREFNSNMFKPASTRKYLYSNFSIS
jgi:hypothetical protein